MTRPSRYIPNPVGRGRRAIEVPLTDDQRERAGRYYPLARKLAAMLTAGLKQPDRTPDENVSDLAWLASYAAARRFDPATMTDFEGYLLLWTRWRRMQLVKPRRSSQAVGIPIEAIDDESVLVAQEPGPEAAVDRRDEVEAILGRLPEETALALWLAAFEGLTRAEVAGRLGCSESTIYNLFRMARTLLATG